MLKSQKKTCKNPLTRNSLIVPIPNYHFQLHASAPSRSVNFITLRSLDQKLTFPRRTETSIIVISLPCGNHKQKNKQKSHLDALHWSSKKEGTAAFQHSSKLTKPEFTRSDVSISSDYTSDPRKEDWPSDDSFKIATDF